MAGSAATVGRPPIGVVAGSEPVTLADAGRAGKDWDVSVRDIAVVDTAIWDIASWEEVPAWDRAGRDGANWELAGWSAHAKTGTASARNSRKPTRARMLRLYTRNRARSENNRFVGLTVLYRKYNGPTTGRARFSLSARVTAVL
jgi:hypothetical protein